MLLYSRWLAGLLVLSAVGVIYSTFVHRQIAHEWQAVKQEQQAMEEEYGRLLLEYSTLAAPSRIESIARDELGMDLPKEQDKQTIEAE
ncbi:MAG: cell division protein FtsL [Oceanospirillaceae bacterium]|nr:cell division protein FtsL [Oceanospirillaceae bacterium]